MLKIHHIATALAVIFASISIGTLSGYLVAATNHNPYIIGVAATGIGSLAVLLIFSPSSKSKQSVMPLGKLNLMSIIVILLCVSFYISSVETGKKIKEIKRYELTNAETIRHEVELLRLFLCSEREEKVNKLRESSRMQKLNPEFFCQTPNQISSDLIKQISTKLFMAPDGHQWQINDAPVAIR